MFRSCEASQLTVSLPPPSPADCRKAVVDGDGLAKLVSFLGNNDYSDLHVLAVSVLSLCLNDAESMVALQSSGCLQQLLQHITSATTPDMKKHAARALAKAATNSEPENLCQTSCHTKQKLWRKTSIHTALHNPFPLYLFQENTEKSVSIAVTVQTTLWFPTPLDTESLPCCCGRTVIINQSTTKGVKNAAIWAFSWIRFCPVCITEVCRLVEGLQQLIVMQDIIDHQLRKG